MTSNLVFSWHPVLLPEPSVAFSGSMQHALIQEAPSHRFSQVAKPLRVWNCGERVKSRKL